jgi:hypothetical protein
MKHWVRSERGNILIMMALAFAVMAGFGILTIDIGRILVTRTQLQNAADAGALAGASLFCNGPAPTDADVQNEVRLVGGANMALENNAVEVDIPNSQITIDRSAEANDVTVQTMSDTRQYLLGLFNIFSQAPIGGDGVPEAQTEAGVTATATARCGGVCSVQCVKPWTIPDRYDDVTGIPGYMGGGPRNNQRPDWRNNNNLDMEPFTDANGNYLYDFGESFTDGNGDGVFNQEAYHPSLTGYGPDPVPGNFLSPNGDIGLELVLHFDNGGQATTVPGQYQSIRLPPINKGTPVPGGDEYRDNIRDCNQSSIEKGDWLEVETGGMVGPTNQGMSDLIAQDPDATWDASTQSVANSNFAVSPRIVLIPIYEPRIHMKSGHQQPLQVVKVAAFFMERMTGPAEVRGKFLKVRSTGGACPPGQTSGFFVYNLSLVQ